MRILAVKSIHIDRWFVKRKIYDYLVMTRSKPISDFCE